MYIINSLKIKLKMWQLNIFEFMFTPIFFVILIVYLHEKIMSFKKYPKLIKTIFEQFMIMK
jgi:hypothetical protein